jgi:hypothetical protein
MPTQYKPPEKVPYLAGEEKKKWAEKGQKFLVVGVRGPIRNTYQGATSERHIYTLAPINVKTGELGPVVQLPMTDNDVRLQVADGMKAALAEDASGVGPCVLEFIDANVPGGGVWSIEPAE